MIALQTTQEPLLLLLASWVTITQIHWTKPFLPPFGAMSRVLGTTLQPLVAVQ